MIKYLYLLPFFSFLLFVGCTEQIEYIDTESNSSFLTKSVEDYASTSNPNLINDWEHQDKIMLSTGNEVSSPWSSGSNSNFSASFAYDVKKEDGWIMLFHTFKKINSDIDINYMVLYNKLTGFFKLFYYDDLASPISTNNGMWNFYIQDIIPSTPHSSSATKTSSLFNLNDYVSYEDDKEMYGSVNISNESTTPQFGFQKGWNGFELELPYTKKYKNILFALETNTQLLLSHTFSGITKNDIEGTIIKTSKQPSSLQKNVATLGGSGAKDLITKLKKKADAKDTEGEVKATLGNKIISALSKVSSSDFSSAILQGLKFIFGSSVVTETQKVHLTANGTIELSGTTEGQFVGAPSKISGINLYQIANHQVNEATSAFNADSPIGAGSIVMPSTPVDEEQYLGVWNLRKSPTLYFSRYSRIDNALVAYGCIQQGTLQSPYLVRKGDVEIDINPNLDPYITDYKTTTEYFCTPYGYADPAWFSFPSELIYSDSSITIVTPTLNKSVQNPSCINGKSVPDKYDYFYDWSLLPPDHFYAVVTVEFNYNYMGKEHKVSSSRTYKVNCLFDSSSDNQILYSGRYRKPYIINNPSYSPYTINSENTKQQN